MDRTPALVFRAQPTSMWKALSALNARPELFSFGLHSYSKPFGQLGDSTKAGVAEEPEQSEKESPVTEPLSSSASVGLDDGKSKDSTKRPVKGTPSSYVVPPLLRCVQQIDSSVREDITIDASLTRKQARIPVFTRSRQRRTASPLVV
jgi:pantothenate kinase